jgi:hypothetical protein
MRFDTKQHKFSCGIDCHARTMVPLPLESSRGEHGAPAYEGGSRTVSQDHGALPGSSRRLRRMPLHVGPGWPTSGRAKSLRSCSAMPWT